MITFYIGLVALFALADNFRGFGSEPPCRWLIRPILALQSAQPGERNIEDSVGETESFSWRLLLFSSWIICLRSSILEIASRISAPHFCRTPAGNSQILGSMLPGSKSLWISGGDGHGDGCQRLANRIADPWECAYHPFVWCYQASSAVVGSGEPEGSAC